MSEADMKGGERLLIGFHGQRPESRFVDVLRETRARGVILFARNLVDAEQARDLVDELRSLVDWPLTIAIDQEGGAVVRLTRGVTVFPGNAALAAGGSAERARRQGRVSGRELASIGIDLNLAPVVDLQTNAANPGIGIRSFGADRVVAAELAAELVLGHAEAGLRCCLKHFPGLGDASVDAHLDLPVLESSLDEFRDPHIDVFADVLARVAGEAAVMTTHVIVRGLDRERPATISPAVVRGLLRGDLGFTGLVVTDCLEMGAIVRHYGVADAAFAAAAAGHDLIAVCHTPERQLAAAEALARALADGRLDAAEHRRSIARIDRRLSATAASSTEDGATLARDIARDGVVVFGDERGLLPIGADDVTAVVLARPRAMVAVEESLRDRFGEAVRQAATRAGLTRCEVVEVELDGEDVDLAADAFDVDATVRRCATADRIVLLGWDAHGRPAMRRLLEGFCDRLADRLIVVHLRNPYDQAFVPPRVTALTTNGFRAAQIDAALARIAGC